MFSTYSVIRQKYPTVLLLGFVSFFADIASEMLYPITPIFLTGVLGASMTNLGFIEGIAEGLSSLLKTYSGFWSDRISKRKPFILFGYLLSAISRPLIGLAGSPVGVLGARIIDRTGKGLRTAPRDAMIADAVDPKDKGMAFGWHRLIDTMGAVVGPLLAIMILKYFTDIRQAYYLAIIPGLLSVGVIFFLKEKKEIHDETKKRFSFKWKDTDKEFKVFIFGWGLFCLTNSSDAFLILKMRDAGLDLTKICLVYAYYNLIYALLSPHLGHLSDRLNKESVMIAGLITYSLAYAGFSIANNLGHFILLFTLYGAYMAATDGVGKSLVTDFINPKLKASGLGIMGTVTGFGQIIASSLTGYIWDQWGPTRAIQFNVLGSLLFMGILLKLKNRKFMQKYNS